MKLLKPILVIICVGVVVAATLLYFYERPQGAHAIEIGLPPATMDKIPIWMTLEKGFWDKEGINVTFVQFASEAALVQATASKQIQVGVCSATGLATAIYNGIKLKFICGIENEVLFWMIGRKASNVTTLQDLVGKKVGVTSFGSLTYYLAITILQKNNISTNSVTFVQIGPQMLESMESGSVDAVVTWEPIVNLATTENLATVLANGSDYLPHLQMNALFVTKEMIEQDPQTCQKLVKGLMEGMNYTKYHAQEAVQVASDYLGQEQSLLQVPFTRIVSAITENGTLNVNCMQPAIDALLGMGVIQHSIAPDELIDAEFLGH